MTESATLTPPSINSPTDGEVLTSNTVSVSGSTETDGTVVIYNGPTALSTVTSSNGSFSTLLSLADGEYALWANVSNGAVTSGESADVHVTVSGQPAPSAEPAPSDSGSDAPSPAPEADGTGDQAAPADAGTPPDAPAPVTADPAAADPATGNTDVQVAQVNPNPDEEPPSPEVTPDSSGTPGGTQVDPQANAETAAATDPEPAADPAAPVAPDAPTIEVPADGETMENNFFTVSGTAEPSGASVVLYVDSRMAGTASVDDKGDWTLEVNLPNAEYNLSASVNDTGRVSARSTDVHVIVNHDTDVVPVEPEDPADALALFLQQHIVHGYPMRWHLIHELRMKAEAWLESRNSGG